MPDTAISAQEADEVLSKPAVRDSLFAGDRRVGFLLGLGIIALLVAVAAAAITMFQIADDTDSVEHTLLVEASTNRLAAFNEQVETGRRGYLIEPGPSFHATVTRATTSLDNELGELRKLTSDNPVQQRRLAEIQQLAAERDAMLTRLFASDADALDAAVTDDFNTERGVLIVRRIRAIAADMAATEAKLLSQRNQSQLNSLIQLYLVGGAALALLVGVLGTVIYTVMRYNRSLSVAQRALEVANEGLEDAVSKRTAELQRANAEIQRFAYIVSHDLRSPLVNVLGFTAELDAARKVLQRFITQIFERHPALKDEEVRLAVEEDLPEALGFIRSSTEKMDRLINSILELSRQGRRQLAPEVLDLNRIAADVVDSLHQRAVDAGATVTVEALPRIESDRLAVEQILSNLVENALKYLKNGRAGEIRIEGRQAADTVHVDVIDNGRGVAPEDHERIFELFRRSGTQDKPGEGIGLANVRALAYRLGGTIEIQSELDQGARFRLSLPAKFKETDQA